MNFLLDTNVGSEAMRKQPSAVVLGWDEAGTLFDAAPSGYRFFKHREKMRQRFQGHMGTLGVDFDAPC